MQEVHRHTLVIDDEAVTRAVVAEILGDVGGCTSCASGEEAVRLLADSPFDVVVSDIRMPGLSGLELLERINSRDAAPKVILLSGHASLHAARRALKSGAFDILPKPFDPQELKRVVTAAARALRDEHGGTREQHHHSSQGHEPLTGLLHHSAFLGALTASRGLCRRRNEPLSLLMIDLDRFSLINETYSHAVGDGVLAWVGAVLKRVCRESDVLARYRWDRFAVAVPGCSETQACELAQRCRAALFESVATVDNVSIPVQGAIGVAESSPGFVETERDLIERAEQALTVAKRQSGRRIVGFSAVTQQRPSTERLDQVSLHDVTRWVATTRQQLKQTYVESTMTLVEAVEAKDPYTRRHSLSVSDYAETLGRRLGVAPAQLEVLKTAAVLHDVGKIGVPDAILRKPGPLTREEYEVVKQHPKIGVQILGHASFLSAELPLILHHHERYDGTGYPAGLSGTDIPFGARILAVADALDAMFSCRSYKDGYDVARVRHELQRNAGSQWDPVVVRAAIEYLDSCPQPLSA